MYKRPWTVFIPLAVFIGLLAALALALRHEGGAKLALHVNELAPVTSLPAVETGKTGFSTEKWRGKPYLVNFFASWCVPCHAEHENLLSLARKYHIPVVGIAFQDKPEAVTGFLAEEGNPFVIVANDSDARGGIDWGISGVPETFLIDRKGIIRFHNAGPLTEDMIKEQLLPLWKEAQ